MTSSDAGSALLGDTRRRPGSPLAAADRSTRGWLAPSRVTVLTIAGLSLMALALRVAILARPLQIVDRLFIPDDTYYTLTIARSMAHGHGPTVDGTTLTSGFQPLLGFLMTPVFWVTNSADAALRVDLALLVVVDSATVVVLAWVAYRLAGRWAAITAAALWAISPVGISMSLGGLETSLAMYLEISLVAAWIWANDDQGVVRWVVVGVIAGLAVLARTDALLLIGLLVAVQLWKGPRRSLVRAGLAGAVVLGPWWVWCALTFGTPLPTSGPAAHHLLPFKSFSDITTSLAAGAVSGGPFQPWDWLRWKLIGHTTLGVFVFWAMVAILLTVAVAWMLRPRRRAASAGSDRVAGPNVWTLAATLPGFAACLLVFYAWYGVTFYFTRYLAPVALVVAVVVATVVGRVVSVGVRWRPAAVVATLAVLVVPTVAAARADAHDLTVGPMPAVPINSAHFYDATTGYRQVAIESMRVPPHHAVVGGRNSGAIGYFAPDNMTVVNIDGVVNPAASAVEFRGARLAEYIHNRHVAFLVDVSLAIDVLRRRLQQLDPGATTRVVAMFPAIGPSPPYEVAEILWSPDLRPTP